MTDSVGSPGLKLQYREVRKERLRRNGALRRQGGSIGIEPVRGWWRTDVGR